MSKNECMQRVNSSIVGSVSNCFSERVFSQSRAYDLNEMVSINEYTQLDLVRANTVNLTNVEPHHTLNYLDLGVLAFNQ